MSSRTYERSKAVKMAWEREQELVREGKGTRDWTPEQQQDILNPDRGRAYDNEGRSFEGQHMKSVERYPEYAGNPDNIQFLTKEEHLVAHKGNWQNPTNWYYDPVTKIYKEFAEDELIPCEVIDLTDSLFYFGNIEDEVSKTEDDSIQNKETVPNSKTQLIKEDTSNRLNETAASDVQLIEKAHRENSKIAKVAKTIGKYIVDNPEESLETIGTVVGGIVSIVSIVSGSVNTNSNSNKDLSDIVSTAKKTVEKANGSSPYLQDVIGHWQRYHTKEGIVWRKKAPYQRGGKKQ